MSYTTTQNRTLVPITLLACRMVAHSGALKELEYLLNSIHPSFCVGLPCAILSEQRRRRCSRTQWKPNSVNAAGREDSSILRLDNSWCKVFTRLLSMFHKLLIICVLQWSLLKMNNIGTSTSRKMYFTVWVLLNNKRKKLWNFTVY